MQPLTCKFTVVRILLDNNIKERKKRTIHKITSNIYIYIKWKKENDRSNNENYTANNNKQNEMWQQSHRIAHKNICHWLLLLLLCGATCAVLIVCAFESKHQK